MEPQQQQQQQQQQGEYKYQYQYNQSNEVTTLGVTPQSSQSSYDPSSSSYYYYPPNSYYYPSDYNSTTYYNNTNNDINNQTHDPNSITPPGVDSLQTHNYYYPPPPTYFQPSNPVYIGGGSQDRRSMRGRGRGAFGRPGRGRGAAHGKNVVSQTPGSSASAAAAGVQTVQSQSAPGNPTARMAWCELCRVDCNTMEILEKHKNGKKHKRNMKVFEELQNLSKQITVQNPQMSMSQPKSENAHSNLPEGCNSNHTSAQNVASLSAHMESDAEAAQAKAIADRAPPSFAHPSELSIRKDHVGGRGGFKRKMRGGRGGKWMRSHDGSRRLVEPPKPKQVVPLLCDLCNVKCESQVVFESHIVGKKHLSNVKRFRGHKEAYGENIQALYPTFPNLPSTSIVTQSSQQCPPDAQALASVMPSQQNLQDPQPAQATLTESNQQGRQDAQALALVMPSQQNLQDPQPAQATLTQSNQRGPQDAQALASMMLSQQNVRDPEAAQAALTQLLNQHGIHDTQTLIAQLVPYVLAQFQLPGLVPLAAAGLGMSTLNTLSQGQHISTGSEGQNVETDQQNTTNYSGTEAGAGTNDPVDDKPPETVST